MVETTSDSNMAWHLQVDRTFNSELKSLDVVVSVGRANTMKGRQDVLSRSFQVNHV